MKQSIREWGIEQNDKVTPKSITERKENGVKKYVVG